jgi:hypothetical protein
MRGGVPLARAAAVLDHHALAERALEIIGQQFARARPSVRPARWRR